MFDEEDIVILITVIAALLFIWILGSMPTTLAPPSHSHITVPVV